MAIQSAEGVARDIDKMYSLGLDPYNLRLLAACITARDAALRAEERAFVLDHMPREAMAKALCLACTPDARWEQFGSGRDYWLGQADAALSAARAALLPAPSLRPPGYGAASLGEAPPERIGG